MSHLDEMPVQHSKAQTSAEREKVKNKRREEEEEVGEDVKS